jgi:apolipoprotein N-acyltransferase
MNAADAITLEKLLPQRRPWRGVLRLRPSEVRSFLFGLRTAPRLPILTGVLLCLCYFPIAWGWLAWAALIPLLTLVRRPARGVHIFLSAWLAGLIFFVPILQWMRVADPRMYFTWIGLALYCSLYLPLAIGLLRLLDRRTRLPLVVTAPVVWTALEYLRAHFATGFPWYFVAHTQHDFLSLIQIADVTGAYGVTFLVVAVNAWLFECFCRSRRFRQLFGLPEECASRRALLLQGAVVVLLLGTALGYGIWRLGQNEFEPGPRVALIQSNLPQSLRNEAATTGGDPAEQMVVHNSKLSDIAAAQRPIPDLIVWPETSYPEYWVDVAPDVSEANVPAAIASQRSHSRQLARDVARLWPTDVLIGLNSEIYVGDQRWQRYNSALLFRPDGQAVDRYDKMHRVPFGEYVPFRDWLPWMNALAPYDFDYSVSPGERFTRFLSEKHYSVWLKPTRNVRHIDMASQHRFGVVICYEDTDPSLARQYVQEAADGPPVDFLVNISNDGWFKGAAEHEEHLAICRFRAVECRRAVARAVNMGVSAVIDGNGQVLRPTIGYVAYPDGTTNRWDDTNDAVVNYLNKALLENWVDDSVFAKAKRLVRKAFGLSSGADKSAGLKSLRVSEWRDFKSVAGVFTMAIPLDRRASLYARWGDWLPILCWIVLLAAIVVARWRGPASRRLEAGGVGPTRPG